MHANKVIKPSVSFLGHNCPIEPVLFYQKVLSPLSPSLPFSHCVQSSLPFSQPTVCNSPLLLQTIMHKSSSCSRNLNQTQALLFYRWVNDQIWIILNICISGKLLVLTGPISITIRLHKRSILTYCFTTLAQQWIWINATQSSSKQLRTTPPNSHSWQ